MLGDASLLLRGLSATTKDEDFAGLCGDQSQLPVLLCSVWLDFPATHVAPISLNKIDKLAICGVDCGVCLFSMVCVQAWEEGGE